MRSSPPRRLLLVSYFYPPVPANSARPLAMAKYLRRRGHDVHVLTTSAFGRLHGDEAEQVIRTPDLVASKSLRRLLRRPVLPEDGSQAPVDKPAPALLTRVVVPELTVLSWAPSALVAARRIARTADIDCVIATTPVESAALVAAALASRAAWVVEFRDPWTFKPDFPTAPQRALDRRLERFVTERADGVVAVQHTAAEELERRFGRPTRAIPNAWDPELDGDASSTQAIPPDGDTVRLVHTGTLSGAWGRRPDVLFRALGLVRSRNPQLGGRLRLVLAGRTTTDEERMLADLDLGDMVQHVGHLPRHDSLALQRSADALLLLTSDRPVETPGKLLEYIGARRPVIALGERSEAARIVRETGVGVCVPGDDVEAVAHAVERAARGELQEAYAPRNLDRYVYPAPAVAMEEEVEKAIARSRSRLG
jgi:glycosyltransferase involved in cell wall biosynthesis